MLTQRASLEWPEKRPIPNQQVLRVWKDLEAQFPRVALMVRDVWCVPGAGVSVEQLFSQARHQGRFNRTYSREAFRAVMLGRCRLAAERKLQNAMVDIPCIDELNYGDDRLAGEAALADYRERVESMRTVWKMDMISDDEDAAPITGKRRKKASTGADKRRRSGANGQLCVVLPPPQV